MCGHREDPQHVEDVQRDEPWQKQALMLPVHAAGVTSAAPVARAACSARARAFKKKTNDA
jgi:hypothetical protein